MAKELEGKPFTLLGINTDASRSALEKGIKKHGVTWPVIYDGPPDEGISNAWNINAYPAVYIVDHNGTIRFNGSRGGKSVHELLNEVPAKPD